MLLTADPSLSFDPVEHRYFVGTRELISVTTALKEAGLVNSDYYTADSAARGTAIHQAIHDMDEGRLSNIDDCDADLRPYVRAYRLFCAWAQPTWCYIEHPVHDAVLGYAGRLDRAGTFGVNGMTCVLDVKTGGVQSWAALQLAAYRRCLPAPHTWNRLVLQLKADGTYALHQYTDRHDEKTFLAALHLALWKRAH